MMDEPYLQRPSDRLSISDIPEKSKSPASTQDSIMAEPTPAPANTGLCNSSPESSPFRPLADSPPSPPAVTGATAISAPSIVAGSPKKSALKRKAVVRFDESDILASSPPAPVTKSAKTAPTPRRKSAARQSRALPIARSYEECEAHDRALLDMRDAGKSWPEINKEWMRITGDKVVGKSTLPNRYIRLKANLTSIKDADKALLIVAKQEIEDELAAEKWARVAAKMVEKGTQSYQPQEIYIRWKKMMLSAEHLPVARDNAHRKSKWEGEIDEIAAGGN